MSVLPGVVIKQNFWWSQNLFEALEDDRIVIETKKNILSRGNTGPKAW